MAGIKGITIRGVRSFGPEHTDQQTICFSKPLTLILGQNGCGKTSIIESLKYGITGQFPPGSKNECFVYDAKVNKTQEVNASVRIVFNNTKGKELTVYRAMQVTSKQKKTQFKTLDSSICRINEHGPPVEISSRCADIDLIMFEELGVSKAIINSVIFCHQEDSAWPLDEGKKVKDRFDEIFDADKYSACFDRLTKIRKEFASDIKLVELKVMHLTEKKSDLDKKKLDVINTEARISEKEIKLMSLDKEMKPLMEKLRNIETVERNLIKYETAKEKAKMKLENCITQQNELKKNIKKIFEGNSDELLANIQNYNKLLKDKEREMASLKNKIESLNKEILKISKEMSANELECSKLILLESQNQEKTDKRNAMIKTTLENIEKDVPDDIEDETAAGKHLDVLQNDVKSKKHDLERLISEADKEELKLQKLVDECRDSLSRHKQKIVSKESEARELNQQKKKLERDIADAEKSKSQLEIQEKRLEEAENEFKTASEVVDVENLQSDINEKEKEIEHLENELDAVNKKIDSLQSQRAKLAEINITQENLKTKEKMLNTLKNKHKASIMELLNRVPESNYAVTVNDCEVSIRKDVEKTKNKLKKKGHEKTSIEVNQQHTRELLKTKKAELSSAEDKLYAVCKSQPYNTVLAKIDADLNKLQEEKNELASSQFIIAKYEKQLHEDNNCPLCYRSFDSQSEVSELISRLSMQIKNVPVQLEKVSEQLSKMSTKRDSLVALKSVQEKVEQLKVKEIPKLEEKLEALEKSYEEVSNSEEEMLMSLMDPERKLELAKQLMSEMPLLDRYTTETNTLNKELEKLKKSCPNIDDDVNYEDTVASQKNMRSSVVNLKSKLKANQLKLNQHMKKIQTLADKKNKLKEDYLNLQRKVQDIYNLQERLGQMELTVGKLQADLQQLNALTGTLEVQLKEQELEKNGILTKMKNGIEKKRQSLEQVKNSVDKIKSIHTEICQHLQRKGQKKIDQLGNRNSELNEVKNKKITEVNEEQIKVEEFVKELSEQELFKRDLEDNLKLRKLDAEAADYEKELQDIITSMGGIDLNMISNKKDYLRKRNEIETEIYKHQGSIDEMKNNLKANKQELQLPHNKNLENEYRQKFYNLQILKTMEKDIKDYSAAMDRCLMQFHKEKMENINLIIREMWHKIYRGNDIDYIQIKTEGSTVTESSTARRKYEYRVVQCKNGVEIDMRGRCSAGQKVLACLIIRLALAETFSTRFGVLALDEPTTNLDEDNVKSLCSALAEIVTERMQQKNFMFIIITHDREFIESLGGIEKVTHFYEVSRNHEGKSRVKKQKFQ